MTDLDRAILDAWDRIWPWLKQNPLELRKRLARRRRACLQHPLRHHCLAVRASDRRITPMHWVITPSHAMRTDHPLHPYEPIEHEVLIQTHALRKFCRPVKIDAWGEEASQVAKKLGLSRSGLDKSRRACQFTERNVPHLGGKRGNVPILHSRRPLDPGSGRFYAAPDPICGPLWQFLPDKIPDNFEQPLIRRPVFYRKSCVPRPRSSPLAPALPHSASSLAPEPPLSPLAPEPPPSSLAPVLRGEGRVRGSSIPGTSQDLQAEDPLVPCPSSPVPRTPAIPLSKDDFLFRGWRWLCPACNKLVRTIFCPLPVRNLCDFLALDPALMPAFRTDSDEPPKPPPTFACRACHHIQHFSTAHSNSWNQLITHLTAGLLYGCEVPRPTWYKPCRKITRVRHLTRLAPRRQQVLRRLLNGWSIRRIARDLQMHLNTVDRHIHILCQQEDVPDRHALVAKLGGTSPPLNQVERANKRRFQIQTLLLTGLSRHQIAQELHLTLKSVSHDLTAIYQLHNVSARGRHRARRALFNKLGHPFPPTPTDLLRQKIFALRETGMTQMQIARQLNVCRQAIGNHLKAIRQSEEPNTMPAVPCATVGK